MASRRQYVNQAELAEYADITITDPVEADDQISKAEELIDSYVGPQKRGFQITTVPSGGVFTPPDYYDQPLASISQTGMMAAVGTNYFQLQSWQQNRVQQDYYVYCEVEIIGGTGAGQRRQTIIGSTFNGVVTIASAWDVMPDLTSMYRIYQLGKFPRDVDMYYNTYQSPPRYYKFIPEAVKRATAAQVEYMINQGATYFASDSIMRQSEHIDNYSYSRSRGGSELLIAPKAKLYLRGLRNSKGRMVV